MHLYVGGVCISVCIGMHLCVCKYASVCAGGISVCVCVFCLVSAYVKARGQGLPILFFTFCFFNRGFSSNLELPGLVRLAD